MQNTTFKKLVEPNLYIIGLDKKHEYAKSGATHAVVFEAPKEEYPTERVVQKMLSAMKRNNLVSRNNNVVFDDVYSVWVIADCTNGN